MNVHFAERDAARFWSKADKTGECWLWTKALDHGGYGKFDVSGRTVATHRFAYQVAHGPIPDGMSVDHVCFAPSCVNPDHLRLMPLSENAARQRKALSSTCKRGHEFTPENTYWQADRRKPERGPHRSCRECRRAGVRNAA